MQIIIDVPEEDYEYIKSHNKDGLYNAILNGTPLPKGHGAIKDISQIEIPMCEDRSYERWVQVAIDAAPTIIEADEVEE